MWRLNWASFGIRESCAGGSAEAANPPPAEEFSIFVGDLSSTVTDVVLLDTFRSSFGSAKSAKVIVDDSGVSKGYGFVRFGDKRERDLAMMEMNGKVCHQSIMRISSATTKKGAGRASAGASRRTGRGGDRHHSQADGHRKSKRGSRGPAGRGGRHKSPSIAAAEARRLGLACLGVGGARAGQQGTTLSVHGVDGPIHGVDEAVLRSAFEPHGKVVSARALGAGCGLVQFADAASAQRAFAAMNGQRVGSSVVRLSWSRSGGADGASAGRAASSIDLDRSGSIWEQLRRQMAPSTREASSAPAPAPAPAMMGYMSSEMMMYMMNMGAYYASAPYAMAPPYQHHPHQQCGDPSPYPPFFPNTMYCSGGVQYPSMGSFGGDWATAPYSQYSNSVGWLEPQYAPNPMSCVQPWNAVSGANVLPCGSEGGNGPMPPPPAAALH